MGQKPFQESRVKKTNFLTQAANSNKPLQGVVFEVKVFARKNFNLERSHCHQRMSSLFKQLNSKLRGYYNYYGLPGNSKALASFFYWAKVNLFKWLNLRARRKVIRGKLLMT